MCLWRSPSCSKKRSNFIRLTFLNESWLGEKLGGQRLCTQTPADPNGIIQPVLKFSAALLGHATTDLMQKQESVEAVGGAFICGEKLLRFIPPAAIHFSKEMRRRCCCYSNSRATRRPILHRRAAFGGRLFQAPMGSNQGCGGGRRVFSQLSTEKKKKRGVGGVVKKSQEAKLSFCLQRLSTIRSV